MTARRGRRHQPLKRRTAAELAQVEDLYAHVWQQRAGDSTQDGTPMGVVFATTAQWRWWRQRLTSGTATWTC